MSVLKPFQIGPVAVELPLVLAPLAGYTDVAFRRVCRRLGATYTASEMLLDRLLLHKSRRQNRSLVMDAGDHPLAGQIVGNEPQTLAGAARVMQEMGFDVVDLNFACPVNKALRRRRGGHLMRDPRLAVEIARAVIAAVDVPVTLKLRARFAESDDNDAFFRIAEGAYEAGAAAVCLHARSVEVKYAGPADWDLLAEARRRFDGRTLLGSGDVHDAQAALDMLHRTGVDGVLAARGVLGNPWLFRQVRDLAAGRPAYRPGLAEQRQVIEEHYAGAVALYGPDRGPKHMRKQAIRYARLHPTPKKLRMAFVETQTPDDLRRVLDTFYPPAADPGESLPETR